MNTELMNAARRRLAVFVALVLGVMPALGQQVWTSSDANRIKAEIENRQAAEQAGGIPEEVRSTNRRILRIRQAQLGYLLEIDGLEKYTAILGSTMLPVERQKIEGDLRDLRAKFDALEKQLVEPAAATTSNLNGGAGDPSAAPARLVVVSQPSPRATANGLGRATLNGVSHSGTDPATPPAATLRQPQPCPAPLAPGFTTAGRFEIDGLYSVVLPPTPIGGVIADQHIVRIFLSDRVTPLPAELTPANFTITYLPSGKVVPTAAIRATPDIEVEAGSNCRALIIPIDYNFTDPTRTDASGNVIQGLSRPASDDKEVKVVIGSLTFEGAMAGGGAPRNVTNLSGTGKYYNSSNFAELAEKELKTVSSEAAAVNKTSQERNIFAGVDVNVPSGGGSTEGSGDININRTLYSPRLGDATLFDRINFGLQLKKGSEERADPRHFTFGFNFRKTFLRVNRQDLDSIRSALYAPAGTLTPAREAEALTAVRNIQHDFVRAYLWDNALRFEGDVSGTSIGNVSNLVFDSQFQIATVTRAFASDTGFLNLRLIPAGFEAGYNMRNEANPEVDKNSLARLKGGGVLTLFYEARNTEEFLNRVEFETQGVVRYLFRRESAFDEATKTAVFTDRGVKYWLQSDLKFLFGPRLGKGRAGFRLSYNRGSLPPVYSFTKAFKFGLVFETTDDTTAEEIKQ